MDIQVNDVSKIYGTGENKVVALCHANMTIHSGDFISIMGPSGSGKSTLLHIISGLDTPTSGKVLYGDTDIHHGSDKELSAFRRQKIGFIFQQFNLLPVLTAQENIIMPLLLDKRQPDNAYLQEIAAFLGIDSRLNHLPHELSGGQQQRVAIARALITKPDIIFADEPTNGVQLIVNEEIYCSLMQDDTYSEIYLTLQDGVDTNSFESILDDWCSKYPGAHWLSYLESSNEMAESFEQIKMLCWVLIIFIGIIGILNIINTVYSNIHTRVDEIGMQRAIGMSAASLYKTFLWEGAYYAIFASVIGAVLGYVCCIFVGAAKTDALQLVAVPVIAIIEAAVVSVAACLLATAIPLHSIAKMNIVESIENVE